MPQHELRTSPGSWALSSMWAPTWWTVHSLLVSPGHDIWVPSSRPSILSNPLWAFSLCRLQRFTWHPWQRWREWAPWPTWGSWWSRSPWTARTSRIWRSGNVRTRGRGLLWGFKAWWWVKISNIRTRKLGGKAWHYPETGKLGSNAFPLSLWRIKTRYS